MIRTVQYIRQFKPLCVRTFQTSSRRNVGFILAPIARIAVAISARLVRRWWLKLTPERRQAFKASIYRKRYYLYGGFIGLAGAGGVYYWTHLEQAPITGRQRFVMVSQTDVIKLIEEQAEPLLEELSQGAPLLVDTDPQFELIKNIVERIISSNWSPEFEGLDWRVIVVDKPDVVNAVCFPGGLVVVFTGLLTACHNEDELAFILGHELAHAVLGHGAEGLSHKELVEFFSLFIVGLLWAVVPSDLVAFFMQGLTRKTAQVLLDRPYSRLMESEADSVGLMFAAKACYSPTRGVKVWTHLPQLDPELAYLSTHPSNEQRLDSLTALLPGAVNVWEQSRCKETREEVVQFQHMLSKALKKLFIW